MPNKETTTGKGTSRESVFAKHLVWPVRKKYHKLHNWLATNPYRIRFYDAFLRSSFAAEQPTSTDISDHLITMFSDIVAQRPKLIVELGTRGGESTRTILAAAKHSRATVLSIDINDCSDVDLPTDLKNDWCFFQADDVEFGHHRFCDWCTARQIAPIINVLFIDTSHLYEHTVSEIKTWLPHLADDGLVIFHDTNLQKVGRTYNNSILNFGWNNERGVIRAVEEFLGKRFNENEFFVDVTNGWLVRHHPNSYGLTMLKKLPKDSPTNL